LAPPGFLFLFFGEGYGVVSYKHKVNSTNTASNLFLKIIVWIYQEVRYRVN
jgi:hypothetical protein